MLYRAKKQQFINISYHRRLKSLTKLWREKMKGARKKKRERENKEKKTLSTTFRTARDGTRIRKKWSTASNFILNLPGRKRRHSDEREATHSWHSRHVERLEARTTSGAVTSFLWWMCCPLPTWLSRARAHLAGSRLLDPWNGFRHCLPPRICAVPLTDKKRRRRKYTRHGTRGIPACKRLGTDEIRAGLRAKRRAEEHGNRQSNESGVGNGFFAAMLLCATGKYSCGTDVARKLCRKNLRVTTIETYNLNEGEKGGKENSSLVQSRMIFSWKYERWNVHWWLFISNNRDWI